MVGFKVSETGLNATPTTGGGSEPALSMTQIITPVPSPKGTSSFTAAASPGLNELPSIPIEVYNLMQSELSQRMAEVRQLRVEVGYLKGQLAKMEGRDPVGADTTSVLEALSRMSVVEKAA